MAIQSTYLKQWFWIQISKWIIKAPKSYAGDRYVTVPIFVAKKFEQLDSDRIEVTPNENHKSLQNDSEKFRIAAFSLS